MKKTLQVTEIEARIATQQDEDVSRVRDLLARSRVQDADLEGAYVRAFMEAAGWEAEYSCAWRAICEPNERFVEPLFRWPGWPTGQYIGFAGGDVWEVRLTRKDLLPDRVAMLEWRKSRWIWGRWIAETGWGGWYVTAVDPAQWRKQK